MRSPPCRSCCGGFSQQSLCGSTRLGKQQHALRHISAVTHPQLWPWQGKASTLPAEPPAGTRVGTGRPMVSPHHAARVIKAVTFRPSTGEV